MPLGMEAVEEAAARIAGQVLRTPLVPLPGLSRALGAEILRQAGASAADRQLQAARRDQCDRCARPTSERARGVVAASTGNHGRALASCARRLGMRAAVCMSRWCRRTRSGDRAGSAPRSASSAAARTTRSSEVERLVARATAWSMMPPFDHPAVIAGQGTIGLEIIERCAGRRDRVLVPLSGGGLAAGVALRVKALQPRNPRHRRLDGARRGDAGEPRRRPAGGGRGTADAGRFARRRHRPRQPADLRHVPRPARRRRPAHRGRDRRRHPPCLSRRSARSSKAPARSASRRCSPARSSAGGPTSLILSGRNIDMALHHAARIVCRRTPAREALT